MSFGRFLFGAILGGAIGAGVGILLAPRSGEETRRLIRDDMERRYMESKEAVNERVDALRDKAEEVGDQLRDSADNLRRKAQEISDELEETGRKTLTKMTDKKA